MIFLFIEVCVHSFFAVVAVGLNSGFEWFIICVVFSIFFVKDITQASRKVIYVLYAFAFLTMISMRLIPHYLDISVLRVYPSESQSLFVFIFNVAVAFFLLMCFFDHIPR